MYYIGLMTETECYVCGKSGFNKVNAAKCGSNEPVYVCDNINDCGASAEEAGRNANANACFPSCLMLYSELFQCSVCRETCTVRKENGAGVPFRYAHVFMELDEKGYNVICDHCYNMALGDEKWQFIKDGAILEKVQLFAMRR